MASRPFKQVDVFTSVPFLGNPVAVVLDGVGLDADAMQAFARWTNLSETTFVCPPTDDAADYELRIFTPNFELPFAGHPTLGSAHAVLDAGLVTPAHGRLVQQCKVGLVEIAVPDDWRGEGLSFRLPPDDVRFAPDSEGLIAAMRVEGLVGDPAVVNVGPRWVIAQLWSAAAVEALKPDLPALADYDRAHGTTGLTVFAETGDAERSIKVRSFAPLDGIAEDPVCGSGNGAVAAFRFSNDDVRVGDTYMASQGREIGRDGKVHVRIAADGIHIGGNCVTCIDGSVTL
jgi:PhzF family phenazine biosynthesis protein